MEPGDVIVAYAGDPVEDSQDLQSRVVATRPGTRVAVEVVRDGEPVTLDVTIGELDLDAEGRRETVAAAEETNEGFGITLQDLTPQATRRLGVPADTAGAVVTDVEQGGTAAAGGLQAGDVILRVNRVDVASAAEAGRRARRDRLGADGVPSRAAPRHARVPAGGEGVEDSGSGVPMQRAGPAGAIECRSRRLPSRPPDARSLRFHPSAIPSARSLQQHVVTAPNRARCSRRRETPAARRRPSSPRRPPSAPRSVSSRPSPSPCST